MLEAILIFLFFFFISGTNVTEFQYVCNMKLQGKRFLKFYLYSFFFFPSLSVFSETFLNMLSSVTRASIKPTRIASRAFVSTWNSVPQGRTI